MNSIFLKNKIFPAGLIGFIFLTNIFPVNAAEKDIQEVTNYALESVKFSESKEQGSNSTWKIIYQFLDSNIGKLEITCYEDFGISKLQANALFQNIILERVDGDFYCFPFYSLVEDLQDVTNGFGLPSFDSDSTDLIGRFDFAGIVAIPIKIEENKISIFSRQSQKLLGEYVVPLKMSDLEK